MKQLSVFLENRVGRLAEITGVLMDAGAGVLALSLADTSEFGILRLITDKPHEICDALRERGFTAGLTGVTVVEMADLPGGLYGILRLLEAGGINVEYMYGFHARGFGPASPANPSGPSPATPGRGLAGPASGEALVFRFDKGAPALDILRGNTIRFLSVAES
jgi:hypothetical protein